MLSSPQQSRPSLILVVDDEPLVRKMIIVMLERAGYQTESAENGKDALKKIKSLRPDLITLDHMMPDFSGEEVQAQIAQDEQTCHIPVIFVSAVAQELQERQVGNSAQVPVRYINKPFQRDVLLTHVREMLEQTKEA